MESLCLSGNHNFLSGFYFDLFPGCNLGHYVILRNSKDSLNECRLQTGNPICKLMIIYVYVPKRED